jgi:hypothetical protein
MSTEHLRALLGRYLGLPSEPIRGVDWDALLALAGKNRVLPLLQAALTPADDAPEAVRARLRDEARRSFVATALVADNLADVAGALDGLRWMLLRGPVLGHLVYADPSHRPFGDLDVLVARADRSEAVRRLAAAGFTLPRRSMPPAYYEAVHLHYPLQRPGLAGPTRLELQWDIDHPFTLYTIDVDGLLDRRVHRALRGVDVPVPAWDDLLITLAIHAIKHATPLPYWLQTGDADAMALTGHLLHFVDIALLTRLHGADLNSGAIADRCAAWGAADAVAGSLAAMCLLWPALAADRLLSDHSIHTPPLKMWLYRQTGSHGFAQLPLLFFRPIRLLDIAGYLFPPAEYLRRKTGRADLLTRLRHALGGAARLVKGGLLALGARLRRARRADG